MLVWLLYQTKGIVGRELAIPWPPYQMALVSIVPLEGCTCNWYPPNMAVGMQMPHPRLIAKRDFISMVLELTSLPLIARGLYLYSHISPHT